MCCLELSKDIKKIVRRELKRSERRERAKLARALNIRTPQEALRIEIKDKSEKFLDVALRSKAGGLTNF